MMGTNTTHAVHDPRQFTDYQMLTKSELVNRPEVSPEQATVNRALGRGPKEPRSEIRGIVNVSDAELDRMVNEGRFPKPRKIGRRAVRWLGRDIREWMEALPLAA